MGSAARRRRPDPANLQPWVVDRSRQNQQEYYKGRPYYQCRPSGPEAERFGGWKRILQTPTTIAILNDDLTYRVIHKDGRELEADAAPSWMGYGWDAGTATRWSSTATGSTTRRGRVAMACRIPRRCGQRNVTGASTSATLQVEVTFTDPGAFAKPWSFTADMALAADTEMLEQICEHPSTEWAGALSDAASRAVSVPPEVLARYVGVYKGIYGGKTRGYEVSLPGGQLTAKIVGEPVEGGLGAVGLDPDAARPLVPLSQTVFEGLGLGYEFIVDDKGVVTDLVVTHISGPYKYSRQR